MRASSSLPSAQQRKGEYSPFKSVGRDSGCVVKGDRRSTKEGGIFPLQAFEAVTATLCSVTSLNKGRGNIPPSSPPATLRNNTGAKRADLATIRANWVYPREAEYEIFKEHCGFAGFSQDPWIACVVIKVDSESGLGFLNGTSEPVEGD